MTDIKKYLVLGLLLLMPGLAPLCAQQSTRVVKGRVLDATTRNPLSGVMVRTAEITGYGVLTDDDGNWTLWTEPGSDPENHDINVE